MFSIDIAELYTVCIYNHARLHRILQNSILQLNWTKKSHRIFGFWGKVFLFGNFGLSACFSNFLLSIDFSFICPREGSGNSWQEEIKDKTKKNCSSDFLLYKTFQKIDFWGFVWVPSPHAGIVKPQYSMYVAFTCFWYHCMWQYHWATNT